MQRFFSSNSRREFLRVTAFGAAGSMLTSCGAMRRKLGGDSSLTIAQICDTQLGFGGYDHDVESFQQTVKQVNSLQVDFSVICGDLVNKSDAKSFADFNRIKAGFRRPCYCVAGNHDVGNNPTPESLHYFRRMVGKDYYSFEHRGQTFVMVNTQLWKAPVQRESELQDSWLSTTLAAAAKKRSRIFVVGHHPFFLEDVAEEEEYFNLPTAKREELLRLFERSGVVAILGGHRHKLLLNEYHGLQMANVESTSRNLDKRPLGFRLWHIGKTRPFQQDFVRLEGIESPELKQVAEKIREGAGARL